MPQSHGGANRYDNLVAACRTCNQQRGSQTLEQWLKRRPQKLAEVQAKLGMELADATHLNVILPRLLQELHHAGWTVIKHSAASTAAGRWLCSVEKSHHADAALTGCPARLRYMPSEPIVIGAKGRGNRQRIMPNKHGAPKGKVYRQYCRLPKHVHGVATGDYVRFVHQGIVVHGYGSISHEQVALTKPSWKSVKADQATVVDCNHGYQVVHP